jgi:cellulose synthase/poly-beta-1,6-N-acetylglucosamine synthase-like glycosyltransferase
VQITKRRSNAAAGWAFLAGLVGIGLYNWRLWRHDKTLATQQRDSRSSAPVLSRTPKVSVLVAAWNEQAHIDAHIRSFMALQYPQIELIICAGGSDDTLARARHYACPTIIILEQQAGEGKQRSLARCFEYASGEIICLTDADCLYTDEALIRLLEPLVEDGEQAATGVSRPLDTQAHKLLPDYVWASDVFAGAHSPQYSAGLLGRNAAMTRQALERSGGLGFTAQTGTDYQLARRLIDSGVAIRYVGNSIVPTEYPETLSVYRRKQSRWLRNLLIYGRRYQAQRDVYLTVRTIATGALMLLSPLTALVFGRSVLVIWALLVAHATASKLRYLAFTARLYRRAVSARLIAGLIPLTLIDFVIWALPILDLFSVKRRNQW